MSEPRIKRIEVPWQKLFTGVEGLETAPRSDPLVNKIVVYPQIIPIVFVPGIMGSRLIITESRDKAWDPDALGFMGFRYAIRGTPEKRKTILVGNASHKADHLTVDNDIGKAPSDKIPFGWENVAWNFYGEILIEPPEQKDKTIIEVKELPGIGRWCRAVLFYHKPISQNTVSLHLMVQFGKNGLWIKDRDVRSSARDIAYEISTGLARAYRPPPENEDRVAVLPEKDSFYLRYGAIDLPFEYDESVRILFRHHPLDSEMVLDVEMDVVQRVEQHGLMDRLAAVILTQFVPGLKIEKIRTRKRTVAGMREEEVVYRGIEDGGDSGLYFAWEYPGRPNSAQFPNIQIGLRARDDNLEEKLALWDAVLDSMRPAGR